MNTFKLTPITSSQALLNIWPAINKGIEKIMRRCAGDTDETEALNEILSNALTLWIGFIDGKYVGFTTTKVMLTPTYPQKKYLWVHHFYKKNECKEDFMGLTIDKLEEHARLMNCGEIKCGTTRRMDKMLMDKGFVQSYVEWRKPLNGEVKKDG